MGRSAHTREVSGGSRNRLSTLIIQFFTAIAAPGWVTSSAATAPSAATGQAGVGTAQELFFLADGASYDPVSDPWSPITATGEPTARGARRAVWLGQEVLSSLQKSNPQPTWHFYHKP
jgi:hypothetical protein